MTLQLNTLTEDDIGSGSDERSVGARLSTARNLWVRRYSRKAYRSIKRVLDVVLALTAIGFLLPLFAIICLGILILDGRPVLYGQARIGHRGHTFKCWKFRSMVRDADARLTELLESCPKSRQEWSTLQKLSNDPRITLLGTFLRKSSLDELPQLFNIVRGDMSIVGPRPIVHSEIRRYGRSIRLYLATRPGLTGLWQVSGRNSLSYQERVALDVRYIRTMSAQLDAEIIFRTAAIVLTGRGDHSG
ncbi:sugar transferase [Pseudorhizobium halotolerans]|uniref:Sugar transferase n=1 Tax=Pseudorhizobium halotolerans TaxID=1233081 RepID=A0ABM8PFB0_9HYPH|nr:sugar transferase [Pseudorhizobium halotolerans]CAD7026848.1 sugar transferase [Pseudorhizobium halotolerans]